MDRMFWSPTYRRVSLPLYPFRRDRHWLRNSLATDDLPERPDEKAALHPLVGEVVRIDARRAVFQTSLTTKHPWTDHRVLGATVFPATAYLEMAARGYAAAKRQAWRSVMLRDVVFERPMVLKYGKPKTVTLTLDEVPANGTGDTRFVIASSHDGRVENFCRGQLRSAVPTDERVSLEDEFGPREQSLEIGPFYGDLRKGGLEYGAGFATIRELWAGKPGSGSALGRVALSPHETAGEGSPYQNAVLLDGCLQVFGAALGTLGEINRWGAFVPAMIQSVTLNRQLPSQVWSHAQVRAAADGGAALVHIRVFDDEGELLVTIEGLELRLKASLSTAGLDKVPAAAMAGSNGGAALLLGSRDEIINHIRELSADERIKALAKWLALEVKDTMGQAAEGLDLENIDPSTAFLEIGLDSLLVTELQRRIQEKLDFRFQPMQGLDYQSIESLAQFILDEVLVLEPG